MKKYFITVNTIVDVLAIGILVFVGSKMLEPHQLTDGLRLAIPAILIIVIGWVISFVLSTKSLSWAVDAVGITYMIATVFLVLYTGFVMGDSSFVLSMFIWAFAVLGGAYAITMFALVIISKRK